MSSIAGWFKGFRDARLQSSELTTVKQRPAKTLTSPVLHEVFVDPTGRRWRLTKACVALLFTGFVVIAALSWIPMQRPSTIAPSKPELPPIQLPNDGNAPEIGAGPLARLIRVVNRSGTLFAVDPFTNKTLDALSASDAEMVGAMPYAMQQYGYSSAAHKTIELTFDDGPDPQWTPKILDLLSNYKAPATFFVIGTEVVKYPDIVRREVRQGFAIGNHSLTHPDLTPDEVQYQWASTDRIIRAVTGVATTLVRLPYDSAAANQSSADTNAVIINTERLHYMISMPEFDTSDWKYGDPAIRPNTPIPLPPTTMDNITILLHDGGGDRSHTLAYLQQLLPWARAHGYTFHSLPQVSPWVVAGTTHITPNQWDDETFWLYEALLVWPVTLLEMLFMLAIVSVVLGGGLNVLLAASRRLLCRRRFAHGSPDTEATGPPVTIVVPAYNEEKVIGRTLEALCRSRYANLREIIVVDDGSSDRTAEVVDAMAQTDSRIQLIRHEKAENAGKAVALNRAFVHAQSPIVVTLDADTLFTPTTVGNLVRPFTLDQQDQSRRPRRPLGAVAGVVKVGNRRNLLTWWQALEYLTMIGVDRGAQDALHAIMVVPGACAAWDRAAVLHVGGYSSTTLAEDCDLALELQHAGYCVTQDDEAVCYTEAPETARALARQRFRWMYGNLQAMWKHRRMIFNPRYGWLGMLTLPLAVISVVVPVVFLPFVYLMAVVTYEGQGAGLVLLYIVLFTAVQLVTATVGIWLVAERPTHLLMVPIYRVIYEPLRAYILYKSMFTILRGTRTGWNKLQRKGTAKMATSDIAPHNIASSMSRSMASSDVVGGTLWAGERSSS